MKKPITLPLVKRKLFIGLLILQSAFTSNAQWSYIATVKSSGDESWCSQTTSVYPFTNFPTKSLCENSRQFSLETFNTASNHCYSTVFCTPCMGSDIGTQGQGSTPGPVSIPGQVNPGDVSINGILEGKSIFTSHQSSAFEDWAQEYKQLLASYGINSILGANFKFPRTPLTDDKAFNILYITLSGNFRPMIKPVLTPRNAPAPTPKIAPAPAPKTEPKVIPPNQDASVVDLNGGKGIVKLFTDKEEQKKRDEWMKNQRLDKLKKLSSNNDALDPIASYQPDDDAFWGAFVNNPQILKMEQHALFVGVALVITPLAGAGALALGATAAEAEAVGIAAAFLVPMAEEGTKALQDCISGPCASSETIATNMAIAAIPTAVGATAGAASGLVAKIPVTGVSQANATEIANSTCGAVFGTLDQTRDNMDTFNVKF